MSAWLSNLALVMALIGYYVTWINHPTAALSANAFDLAEWVGIIPAVRYAEPPMSAPFALRAALVCLAWLFALRSAAAERLAMRVMFGVISLALALSLRPPIAFFRGETADPNYQQLAALCLTALIGVVILSLISWHSSARRVSLWLAPPLALIGAVSAVLGLRGALEALARLQIATPLGAGVFLYLIGTGLHGALCTWLILRAQRAMLGM
ncbi:MAG: hypothetical protein RML95_01380 [Anaerolineae bacterium]|nr:hypothetical protein [Anaerolineae bacterium]MDW8297966.1 hypothetical protein [Anaerolineae bacterium]